MEPLLLEEARLHLRKDSTTEDFLLQAMIIAAREQVEHKLQRALLTQTWDAKVDEFPSTWCASNYPYSEIDLPMPPLQSVTWVHYLDSNGAEQTLATTEYVVDTSGLIGKVRLAYGKSWPSTYDYRNAVTIRFVAGWTNAAKVPKVITAYMKLFIEAMDKNRSIVKERELFLTPFAERLLDRYRVMSV